MENGTGWGTPRKATTLRRAIGEWFVRIGHKLAGTAALPGLPAADRDEAIRGTAEENAEFSRACPGYLDSITALTAKAAYVLHQKTGKHLTDVSITVEFQPTGLAVSAVVTHEDPNYVDAV